MKRVQSKEHEQVVPFGAQFAENFQDGSLPPTDTWAWEPGPEANKGILELSWPGQTCTNQCNDQRPDEMRMKK